MGTPENHTNILAKSDLPPLLKKNFGLKFWTHHFQNVGKLICWQLEKKPKFDMCFVTFLYFSSFLLFFFQIGHPWPIRAGFFGIFRGGGGGGNTSNE